MDVVTKRLHISGLTPNISPKDLEGRFSSFGTVTALDGLGLRDGNGDPRQFAYVTLEGSKAQVAKCLNVLSDATWKGTKLRVGEAKADYRERIAKENNTERAVNEDCSRPKKRRRLLRGTHGVHASDMSLVTWENCASRSGGWVKTPMGRLVRPMRMRPVHPLPSPSTAAMTTTTNKARQRYAKEGREKREKREMTRIRRKLINPLLYGSEYLKGMLLEGEVCSVSGAARSDVVDRIPNGESPLLVANVPVATSKSSSTASAKDLPSHTHDPKNDLRLLDSLFGGGQESLSGVDVMDSRAAAIRSSGALDDDFEVVLRAKANKKLMDNCLLKVTASSASMVQATNLKDKDMFVPREQDAEFSLFANLDLELDDDITHQAAPLLTHHTLVTPSRAGTPSIHQPPSAHTAIPTSTTYATSFRFDPNRTLFFPRLPNKNNPKTETKQKRDLYSVLNERDWLDAPPFERTESEEEIRRGWEEKKADLTVEWKVRWRAARKRG